MGRVQGGRRVTKTHFLWGRASPYSRIDIQPSFLGSGLLTLNCVSWSKDIFLWYCDVMIARPCKISLSLDPRPRGQGFDM